MERSLSSWRAWIEITRIGVMSRITVSSLSSWRAWIEMSIGDDTATPPNGSLSSWRAWIEIHTCVTSLRACLCRSPHGERGLKYDAQGKFRRGSGRSPHGERGLKSKVVSMVRMDPCRSPHGERGLKYLRWVNLLKCLSQSLSSWRAWIEIPPSWTPIGRDLESLSSWRAWIEI